MKKNEHRFQEESFLTKAITALQTNHLLNENLSCTRNVLKRMLMAVFLCLFAVTSVFGQDGNYQDDQSSITVRAQQAPPPLPEYVQPQCPGDGYIWTPGYWSWRSNDYYWVPGVWVLPPEINLLWTPGYWGFYDNFYGWHPGYWGPRVGYYGGINYGFGYFGTGFYGGRWEGGHFMYNTSVWRVGKNIHNTYINKVNIVNRNRSSFNGSAGVNYRPNKDEMGGMRDNRVSPSREQMDHEQNMGNERGQFHNNNPKPEIHSMSAPGGQRFDERGREMKMGGGMRMGGGRRGR
ncbi:hypothetical protein M2347_001709 [Chryseobacterium sp. H1D6B]|uniref:YXWGXW repeat-containing protein n=1 Tax=Chryseobacterium sp. H1D6B TaxID=2940588 RepID=UPI001829835C|nr:YXWGXW repeat-containing protein [Chryseobacterium sp. H1D6B]MDH6251982.1 hypothetical protein [Chryseobacterium sp. H1D6B]